MSKAPSTHVHTDHTAGNATGNLTGNATASPSAAVVQDGTAALLTALEAAGRSEVLADAMLLILASGILVSCCFYRPKLTSIFVMMWVLWLLFRLMEGEAAWTEIAGHARHAKETTETAVGAIWAMLLSWFILAAPVAVDLQRLLTPSALFLQQRWDGLSMQEKGVGALFLVAICSTVWAAQALCKHRDTVKDVGFQLSFAVIGPCMWWLTVQLPHGYAALLVSAVMSFVPSLMSIAALSKLEQERSTAQKATENLAQDSRWFPALSVSFEELHEPFQDSFSEDLELRMRLWVSYWACWPFFDTAYTLMSYASFIDEKEKPAVDGIFVALMIWAQFWRASRIVPCVFMVCAVFLRRVIERTTQVAEEARTEATDFGLRLYMSLAGDLTAKQWLIIGVLVLAVIAVLAVFLQVVAIAEALITLLFLVAVAFDCARCAARRMSDAYAPRLSFWVLAMLWLSIRRLPIFGSALAVWTPLVLMVALVTGETLLNALLYLLWRMSAWARHKCFRSASEPDLENRGTVYDEVSCEEDHEENVAQENMTSDDN